MASGCHPPAGRTRLQTCPRPPHRRRFRARSSTPRPSRHRNASRSSTSPRRGVATTVGVGYRAFNRFSHAKASLLAAGTTYHLFLAMFAIIAFGYGVAATIGSEEVSQYLTEGSARPSQVCSAATASTLHNCARWARQPPWSARRSALRWHRRRERRVGVHPSDLWSAEGWSQLLLRQGATARLAGCPRTADLVVPRRFHIHLETIGQRFRGHRRGLARSPPCCCAWSRGS